MDNATGDLYMRNSSGQILMRANTNIYISNYAASETRAAFINNGAVELYYDNSKKFNTLTNGVQVSGSEFISEGTIYLEKSGAHHHRILANDTGNDLGFQQSSDTGANTNFTTYLRINDGGNISLPVDSQELRLGASADLRLLHNGTHSYVVGYNTGNLYVGTTHSNNMIFQTNNTGRWSIASTGGDLLPEADNSYDIGHPAYRVANVYTTDLHCSNKGSSNDVDGTWGDYTIQEGESDLVLINNRSGKKYKFNLTEVS